MKGSYFVMVVCCFPLSFSLFTDVTFSLDFFVSKHVIYLLLLLLQELCLLLTQLIFERLFSVQLCLLLGLLLLVELDQLMLLDSIPFVDFTLQIGHYTGWVLTGTIVEAGYWSEAGVSAVTTGSLWESVLNSFGPRSWSSANLGKVVYRPLVAWPLTASILHILSKSSVLLLYLSDLRCDILLVDVVLPVFQNGVFLLSEVGFHLDTLVQFLESHIVNSFSRCKTSNLVLDKHR